VADEEDPSRGPLWHVYINERREDWTDIMRRNRIVCMEDTILWKYHFKVEDGRESKSRPSISLSAGGPNDDDDDGSGESGDSGENGNYTGKGKKLRPGKERINLTASVGSKKYGLRQIEEEPDGGNSSMFAKEE